MSDCLAACIRYRPARRQASALDGETASKRSEEVRDGDREGKRKQSMYRARYKMAEAQCEADVKNSLSPFGPEACGVDLSLSLIHI